MNLKIVFFLTLLTAARAFAQHQTIGEAPSRGRWHRDVDEAYRAARAQRAPLVVYFHHRDDTNCRRFEREVLGTHAFAAHIRNVFAARMAVTDDGAAELLRRLSVRAVPTVVVLSTREAHTKVIGRIDGSMPNADALATFARLVGSKPAARAPSKINHPGLGRLLRAAGYDVQDKGNLYHVLVKQSGWTIALEVGVSESNNYVWFSVRLQSRAKVEGAPRDQLVALLAQNMQLGSGPRFQLGTHFLYLSMPVEAGKVDAKSLPMYVAQMIKYTKSTHPAWKQRHEQARPTH